MKNLILFDETVRVDEDDHFINLTDMWKASGSDNKNRPNLFLSNEKTKEFINSLNVKAGFPALRIQKGGKNPGTWAHKFLAYEYASWINPQFKIGAYMVFDDFFSGKLSYRQPMDELHNFTKRLLMHEKEGSFHGRGLALTKKKKKDLIEEGEKLLDRHQLSIF